jgi:hypothetical protein
MRAPDNERPVDALDDAYTAAQWQRIEKSLPGIDLDTTMVKHNDPQVGERSLRDVLQALAWYFGAIRLDRSLTPKQQVAALRKGLAKLKAVRDIVAETDLYDIAEALTLEQKREREATYHKAWSTMTKLITEWEQRLDRPTAVGGHSSENARKVHIRFWTALTRLWRIIPAANGRRRHRDLQRFLSACSTPLFPETTSATALSAFIERHFPQTSK